MGELQEIKVTQFIQETASLGEIKWFRLEFQKNPEILVVGHFISLYVFKGEKHML